MSDTRVQITRDVGVSAELLATGATCADNGFLLECSLGALASGAVLNGTLRLKSDHVDFGYVAINVSPASGDTVSRNSNSSMRFDVRYGIDVAVANATDGFRAREGLSATKGLTFFSKGVQSAQNITATLVVPDEITISAVNMAGGKCTFESHSATCTLPSMSLYYAGMDVTFAGAIPGTYTGTFTVAAQDDALASNNTAALTLEIVPNVDARVVVPTNTFGFVNEPLDLTFAVVNDRYALADSLLILEGTTNLLIDSVTASRGSCSVSNFKIECPIGVLQPNETFTVNVQARATSSSAQLSPRFSSPDDIDFLNNQQQFVLTIDQVSRVVLRADSTTATGVVGQNVALPWMHASATTTAYDAYAEIEYDPAVLSSPTAANAWDCQWDMRPARCSVSVWITDGLLQFSFVPLAAGTYPVSVAIHARNARDETDAKQTIQVTVQEAPKANPPSLPPAPSPAASSGSRGSGGGGGGSSNLVALLVLLLLASAKCLRDPQRTP
jgi:hypothetical protein